jgi:hypothetical protein
MGIAVFKSKEKARTAMFRKQYIQIICERLTPQTAGPLALNGGQNPEDRPIRVIEIRNFDGVPLFPFYRQTDERA